MSRTPDTDKHDDPNPPSKQFLSVIASNRAIRLPLVLTLVGVMGGIMSVLSDHLPSFVVVAAIYLVAVLCTVLLLQLPKLAPLSKGSAAIQLWLFILLGEASAVILIYSRLLRQRQDVESHIWFWIGIGTAGLLVVILGAFHLVEKYREQG